MRLPVDLPVGHPGLGLDPSEPVGEARNAALTVFADMLLADPADGNLAPRPVGEGEPEDTFGLEDALRMLSGQSSCLFLKTSCHHWGFPEWHR